MSSGNRDRARFLLFISNGSSKSRQAERNARHILDEDDFQVVDITEDAESAERYGVLAAPTLVKSDDPQTMIIGTLNDPERVRDRLGLPASGQEGGYDPS